MTSAESPTRPVEWLLPVTDYALRETLASGQAFRWRELDGAWEGVIANRWVRLRTDPAGTGIQVQTMAEPRSAEHRSARSDPRSAEHRLGAAQDGHDSRRAGARRSAPWNGAAELNARLSPARSSSVPLAEREHSNSIASDEIPRLPADCEWLEHYLQTRVNLREILATFPDDAPMRAAVAACPGLRLLRQDPWECLASFILSSTKQIVQIQQIVALLCARFGARLDAPAGHAPVFGFPTAPVIAALNETALRDCKMGFRAPYLLGTARLASDGTVDLARLANLSVAEARAELLRCPGVGRKIADCVLLFAYGFQDAFPVDVWVRKALQQLYFPRRRASEKRLAHFAATHFGPNAGYAQQYLFHYMRTRLGRGGQ